MANFADVTKQNMKKHNPDQPRIPDHLYRILINGGSGSEKINSLFNLMSVQPDVDKIYLYAKDPYRAKYQFLIKKSGSSALKHLNYSKALIEYSNNMDDIYKDIEK